MKKLLLSIAIALFSTVAFSQVGIGNTSPKATLDITGKPADATSLDGVIVPRLTGAQLSAKTYTADQTGATVYVTAANPSPAGQTLNVTTTGLFTFNGTVWLPQTSGAQNIYNTNGTLTGNRTVTQGANTLAFTSTATNGFSVDGTTFSVDAVNNRIGIGTSNPLLSLDITGTTFGLKNSNAWDHLYFNHDSTKASITAGGAENGLRFNVGNSAIGTYDDASQNYVTAVTMMPITGNVGVGVTNPIQRLDINGRMNVSQGVIQNGGAAITATEDLGLYNRISGRWMRFVTNNAPLTFFTSNGTDGIGADERLRITETGSVGIGTTAPTQTLDVNGGARIRSIPTATSSNQEVLSVDANGNIQKSVATRITGQGVNLNQTFAVTLGSLISASFRNNWCNDGTINFGTSVTAFTGFCILNFDGTFTSLHTDGAGTGAVTVVGNNTSTIRFRYINACDGATHFIQFSFNAGNITVTSDNRQNSPIASYLIR